MTTISVTQARKEIFKLLDDVISNNGDPVVITSKKGSGVLMSLDEWNSVLETLKIMSNKVLQDEIKDGIKESISDCSETLPW